MSGETEAAGDVLTGAVIARAVEPTSGEHAEQGKRVTCLNCGAPLSGAYCAACGQPAHLHRSLLSLGHDILHGVFHFEGKIWRTLPELLFHPGRLTRRYIDGERAKFVSPMALFLFTVFLIFAVFAFMGPSQVGSVVPGTSQWRTGYDSALADTNEEIEQLRERLADPSTPVEEHAELQAEIDDLELAREAMEAVASADWKRLAEIEQRQEQKAAPEAKAENASTWPPPGSRLHNAIEQVKANPELLSYKIKTSAYKYSWALIPLSVPFVWFLFFWRRDIHLYDHAIFVTYSITFMMLLALLLSLAAALGVPKWIWVTAMLAAPPLHLYKQLRGAYGLSRFGAIVRLLLLAIFIVVILSLFFTLLVVAGLWS